MKKLLVIASVLITAAAAGTAEAQSRQTTFTAPTGDARTTERTERRGEFRAVRPTEGAIPRAARGGNPAQMINPMAPRRYYGSVEDTVTYDPNNPSRITGIILFGIRW